MKPLLIELKLIEYSEYIYISKENFVKRKNSCSENLFLCELLTKCLAWLQLCKNIKIIKIMLLWKKQSKKTRIYIRIYLFLFWGDKNNCKVCFSVKLALWNQSVRKHGVRKHCVCVSVLYVSVLNSPQLYIHKQIQMPNCQTNLACISFHFIHNSDLNKTQFKSISTHHLIFSFISLN